jgi:hypothetical protein
MALFRDPIFLRGEKAEMKQLTKSLDQKHGTHVVAIPERWNEGIANYEKLKKLLPFLNEEEGYL